VAEDDRPAAAFDGVPLDGLRDRLGLPQLHLYEVVASTLDVAHRLGQAGAPAGAGVLADRQTRGRGRAGRSWSSPAGSGLWLTLLERPSDASRLQVLTLRLGLAIADVLDAFTESPVRLKWPNDLHTDRGKVAGVLVEARWRGASLDWLALGVGVNIIPPPGVPGASGLAAGTERLAVLERLVPALRAAAGRPDERLSAEELRAYDRRDLARGRACVAPVEGVVRRIGPRAELVVATSAGDVSATAGSLVFREGV
jgi:BirA family biotin operon repressor/biotin-[acetyl-CoA-carboxylase] ligase